MTNFLFCEGSRHKNVALEKAKRSCISCVDFVKNQHHKVSFHQRLSYSHDYSAELSEGWYVIVAVYI
jgi:hypothetical protein